MNEGPSYMCFLPHHRLLISIHVLIISLICVNLHLIMHVCTVCISLYITVVLLKKWGMFCACIHVHILYF